jgi:hypothetical protein
MRKYIINNKSYLTICNVHEEIKNIFREINNIKPNEFKTSFELYHKILRITEFGLEYTNVAKEMGQHMENGLKYIPEDNIYSTIYNTNFYNLLEEEEDIS